MFKVVTSSVFKELLLVLRSQTHAYSLKVVLAKKDTIYWKSTPVISICHFPYVFLPYLFVFFPMCSYISSISNMSNHQYSHWSLCVFVAQSCPTLCDPKDCSSPGSSVYVILQARILEWGAIAFSVEHIYWAEYYSAHIKKESASNATDLGLITGWKDPLEKEMAPHSSILAWRIT